MSPKPPKVFDREHEWERLSDFVDDPSPGIQLAIVYGRRRVGKSFLLRHLAAERGGFYHQALEQDRRPTLDRLAREYAQWASLSEQVLVGFDNWEAALDVVLTSAGAGPRLVVLDELPYLLAGSPELPSALQQRIDQSRVDSTASVKVVLSGSALSVMSELLSGTRALRGRAQVDLPIRAFDYRLAAEYWGVLDRPEVAFLIDAVVGGTPGYLDLLAGIPRPSSPKQLGAWLARGVLDPAHALFREDEYLLAEERSLTDRALYLSVIGAIADRKTSQAEIGAAVGRDANQLRHPLVMLERTGFIDRLDDAFRRNRPRYRLADPIVRFHMVVTRPDRARFEDRRTAEAWADVDPRFRSNVLGPHFEDLARQWTRRFASSSSLGGTVRQVAPAVVSCRQCRATHEIDVVASGANSDGDSVLLVGEAKYTAAKRTTADLDRLDHVVSLVASRSADSKAPKVAIFAGNGGFDAGLRRAAAGRADVELIDIDRLYRGD